MFVKGASVQERSKHIKGTVLRDIVDFINDWLFNSVLYIRPLFVFILKYYLVCTKLFLFTSMEIFTNFLISLEAAGVLKLSSY
jgi:hypothetical protein